MRPKNESENVNSKVRKPKSEARSPKPEAQSPASSIIRGRGRTRRIFLRFDFVPIGRLDMQQVMDEKVEALTLAVLATWRVTLARQHDELECLVRLDQCIDNLQRRSWIDVLIHLPNGQQ